MKTGGSALVERDHGWEQGSGRRYVYPPCSRIHSPGLTVTIALYAITRSFGLLERKYHSRFRYLENTYMRTNNVPRVTILVS